MKYAKHDEHIDSNIGWIRDFPAHWELKRLKYVANRAEVKVEADEDNPLPYIGLEQVEPWTGRLVDLDDDLVPTGVSNRFEAGDTLFGKLRPYLAKACNVDFDGLCSSELLVLRGKTYDRKFLLYQLLSHGFINLVDSSTYGSKMPRASWDFIGICELPLPPVDEQRTIARFLDAKTAQIDALVAQKRQLVAKLKEKRRALISRTVTRGLPPDAAKAAGLEPNPEMKDSGVEWIGRIPHLWAPVPLGYLVKMRGGATPDKGKPEYWDGEIPWVSPKDMKVPRIFDAEDHISDEGLRNSPLSLIPNESLLIVVRGMILAHSFPVALSMRELTINQDMKALVCSRRIRPEFLYWALCGFSSALVALADESAHGTKKIEATILAKFPVLVPPITEQQAITAYLHRETKRLDQLGAKIEAAVSRLTEYRQALITSAVTGKIDVREVA